MFIAFLNEICSILGMEVPVVAYDTTHFESETTMAQCDFDNYTVYMRPFDKPTPDIFFALCHELRHLWQHREDNSYYFDTYFPRGMFANVEEYNMQIAEIDANAFAGLMMEDFFEITPLFVGLSDRVKACIYDRMDYLDATL